MFTWYLLDENSIMTQKNVYMPFKTDIFFIFVKNENGVRLFFLCHYPLQKVFIPLPSLFSKGITNGFQ